MDRISTEQIAEATLRCLRGSVPSEVPGIVFLSGGQTEVEATERLNAINLRGTAPWELSFSFGRALQESALRTWNGLVANVAEAQAAFADRARLNAFARNGLYDSEMEKNQHSLVCN
jgi:fructose-bisphosphate aldolase class I